MAIERRAFLRRARDASLGMAVGGSLPLLLSACAGVPYAHFRRSGNLLRVPRAAFETSSGVLLDFPDEGMPIYVHRHGEERYSAVLTRCTHQGCQTDPDQERIRCPCHGSEYSMDGRVLQGPAERALTRYAISIEGDEILVDVGR